MKKIQESRETLRKKQNGTYVIADDPSCRSPKRNRTSSSPKITVHLIPHSHMDLGWVKTVDELYTGHNFDDQKVGYKNQEERIEYTLDTVIATLTRDSEKTFALADVFYFRIWYNSRGQKV